MIKIETIGMLDVAKNSPILVSDKDVANYSFIVDDGELYLIANTIVGDAAYREDVVIKAGEFLNGFLVKAWEAQKLVVDGKHINGKVAELKKGDVLVAGEDGKLVAGEAAGVHFVVADKTTLTEAAVKVKVVVA